MQKFVDKNFYEYIQSYEQENTERRSTFIKERMSQLMVDYAEN